MLDCWIVGLLDFSKKELVKSEEGDGWLDLSLRDFTEYISSSFSLPFFEMKANILEKIRIIPEKVLLLG